MLICQVVSGLMYGGGQRVALDLASGLRRRHGLRTMLVRLGRPRRHDFPEADADTVDLEAYDGRYNRPVTLARTAWSLARVIRTRGVSLVHSHGWDADVIAGCAARVTGIGHVAHQHIVAEWAASRRPFQRARQTLTRMTLAGARTRWVAVSHAVKESLAPLPWLPQGAINVVANGVDVTRFVPASPRVPRVRPVIGVAARLAPIKGLEYLIDAVAHLNRSGAPCDLRIAGDGPLKAELEAQAVSRGVAHRVSFLGQLTDMASFYRSLDVYALPSLSEGMPLSILEAMASGLPVVSTAVAGIPEVVRAGITGTLVPPRDTALLAEALAPLLDSAPLRLQLGAEGRRCVEQSFSMNGMLDGIDAMYRMGEGFGEVVRVA